MRILLRNCSALAGLMVAATLLPPTAALGQQAAPAQPRPAAAQQTAKTAPKTQAKAEPAPGDNSGRVEAQLRQRIEQLEEQLADMQVMVGTLESLTRNGGSGAASQRAPASGGGGGDPARIDQMEQQMRQLSAQVEQLSAQVRALGGRGGQVQPVASPFGTTTVTPDTRTDPIDRILSTPGAPTAGATPAPGDGNPKQAYEAAYAYLLQQDYGAAEAAFDDFLRQYPGDPLAGNAQYWLGETFFVRGNYRSAAGAFLKGYQTYQRSAKAPDSLLKLAMSLDRLGQKDQACASFGELGAKYPAAPANVRTRADSERRRIGCT